MRNLLQYPITMAERIACISQLYEKSLLDLAPGDLIACILYDVLDGLKRQCLHEEGIRADHDHKTD